MKIKKIVFLLLILSIIFLFCSCTKKDSTLASTSIDSKSEIISSGLNDAGELNKDLKDPKETEYYTKENGLIYNVQVFSVCHNANGIYLGTDLGVNYIKPDNSVTLYTTKTGHLTNDIISDVYCGEKEVYVTSQGGLDIIYSDGTTVSYKATDFGSSKINAVYHDSTGTYLALDKSTLGAGVHIKLDNTKEYYSKENGLVPFNSGLDIYHDSTGVYIVTANSIGVTSAVSHINIDKSVKTYSKSTGHLPDINLRKVFHDESGIFVLSEYAVTKIDITGKTKVYSVESGDVAIKDVRDMWKDSAGLYIAPYGKLNGGVTYIGNDGSKKILTVENKELVANSVKSLFKDSTGLYIATDQGLSILKDIK